AIALRAGKRLVTVVNGSSHKTISAPLSEIMSPYIAVENPLRVISRLMVEKTCTNTRPMPSTATNACRNLLSVRKTRTVSNKVFPASLLLKPLGNANHATRPYSTEVAASPMKSHKKDFLAKKPAVAGPKANPALSAIRYAAKAVTLCPAGTKSANSAELAGRYNPQASP